MIRRKLTVLVMCIMSLNLVACSNTDNTLSKEQIEENTVSLEINKEKELFDEAVIIANDEIANVKITGKEKVTPGNSIGYSFSISNKSNKKIAFYMKNITINGNEQKTSLDENLKMTLEPNTDFSTQIKVLNIESLDELKNAKGTFGIEVNDNVNEYKFEIE
ncbi:MAG: hypothetical protein SOT71_05005 [Romboutsia timonensis]|uniref:hypothetical protein n=1 Tax=Romboutsia timonensis TaxID=1776391 RepID=UPI002A749FF6|nr:hypothetical protein [Romboutsia timonensis]MDY2881992.1 hypothetical protein [Romboutsia timonensis]